MNQEQLVEDFFEYFKEIQSNPELKQKIEDYLLGKTRQLDSILKYKDSCISYIFYSWIDRLAEEFDKEAGETAKRVYYLTSKIATSKFISACCFAKGVYENYKKAGIEEDVIEEDIYNRCNNLYYFNFNRIKEVLQAIKEKRSVNNEFFGLFSYYDTLVDRLVKVSYSELQIKGDKNTRKWMALFHLKVLGSFWYEEGDKRREEYRKMAIEAIYSGLKALYGESGAGYLSDHSLFTEEAETQYKNAPIIFNKFEKDQLRKNVFIYSYLLIDEFPLAKEAFKLLLLFYNTEPKSYIGSKFEKECDLDLDDIYEWMKKLSLPLEPKLRLAANWIFGHQQKEQEICLDILITCYKEERKEFYQLYQNYKKKKSYLAIPLLAVICKNELESEESRQADDILLQTMESMEKNSKYRILYDNQGTSLIEIMTQKDFNVESITIESYHILSTCGCLLYDFSKAARRLVTIIFKSTKTSEFLTIQNGLEEIQEEKKQEEEKQKEEGKQKEESKQKKEDIQAKRHCFLFDKLAKEVGIENVLAEYPHEANSRKQYKKGFEIYVRKNLEKAIQVFTEKRKAQDEWIMDYVNLFYKTDMGMPYEELALVLEHRLKTVLNAMENFLEDKEKNVRPYIEKLKTGKNKNAREVSARLLKLWDEEKVAKELKQINDKTQLDEYIKKLYESGNRSRIPYIDELDLSQIRFKQQNLQQDSQQNLQQDLEQNSQLKMVPKEWIEYYLSEYMLLKEVKKIKICEKIRDFLNSKDLNILTKDIYMRWLKNGADTKQKNILMPYIISADTKDITELKKVIDDWTEHSRGAIAAFAVSVMILNNSDITLLILDSIANKYKNKQVKSAAETAMNNAAQMFGITRQALEDRIIPALGFKENREQIFDYGTRAFKGILTQKLEILLYDETGKQIKNLPKPGAKDEKELAEQTQTRFKELKKQLKTVITSQKNRLETAIITGRKWSKAEWEKLFVKNPVMNGFAIGLIWGECTKEGELIGTFRYMEDGSFNSVEEEEYELKENSFIFLLHPLDVSRDIIETWKTQLEDYEIIQPVNQLSMMVYTLTKEELEQEKITQFTGKKVYFGTIRSIMDKYGWSKTSVVDAGSYDGYYFEEKSFGVGIQMLFEWLYIGMAPDEAVTIRTIEFYKADSVSYGSYIYDEITNENRIFPKDVPVKLVSFACMIGELLAAKALP